MCMTVRACVTVIMRMYAIVYACVIVVCMCSVRVLVFDRTLTRQHMCVYVYILSNCASD